MSCRSGRCGICRLRVRRGSACFEPPGSLEVETLRGLGAQDDERLGCQLWLAAGARGDAELLLLSEAADA